MPIENISRTFFLNTQKFARKLNLFFRETSQQVSHLLQRMNKLITDVRSFSITISIPPQIDAYYFGAIIDPILKFKDSVKSLSFQSCSRMQNKEEVWDRLSKFENVRKLTLSLSRNIANSGSLKDCLKSLKKLRKLRLENFGKMLNENEFSNWLSEIFTTEASAELKHLKILPAIGADLKIGIFPIVQGILEKLQTISIGFSFQDSTHATVFQQIFKMVSGSNTECKIRISSPYSFHGPYFPMIRLKDFLEFLFTISDQRTWETGRNLVRISFQVSSDVNIQDEVRLLQDSRIFERIEITGSRTIARRQQSELKCRSSRN